jgi:hypothetical protein
MVFYLKQKTARKGGSLLKEIKRLKEKKKKKDSV